MQKVDGGPAVNFYFKIINNKYIFAYNSSDYHASLFMLTNVGKILKTLDISNYLTISSDGKFIITKNTETEFVLNGITMDYDQGEITVTELKKFQVADGDTSYLINSSSKNKSGFVIGDSKYFLFIDSTKSEIYSVDFTSNEILTYIDSEDSVIFTNSGQIFDDSFIWEANIGGFSIFKDYSEIIGLKYKGNYYYKMASNILTAKPEDVTLGKTFIGKAGEQETGTMEV